MEQNPHLGQLFESNPEALMQLLNGGDDTEGDGAMPPGAQVIHITPEEQAAIGRVSLSTRILELVLIVRDYSWRPWVSRARKLLRHIWHVIRMRNSQPIICLRLVLMTRRTSDGLRRVCEVLCIIVVHVYTQG
jgi:hypothetical protein